MADEKTPPTAVHDRQGMPSMTMGSAAAPSSAGKSDRVLEKEYEQRRAGLIPADPEADKVAVAARAKRLQAEADAARSAEAARRAARGR